MKQLLTKSILPMALFLLIAYLGKYIYIVDDQINWFRVLLIFGLPYGIPYMIFIIPIGRQCRRENIAPCVKCDLGCGVWVFHCSVGFVKSTCLSVGMYDQTGAT